MLSLILGPCHGEYRLEFRVERWTRKTGIYIHDMEVRNMFPFSETDSESIVVDREFLQEDPKLGSLASQPKRGILPA